MTVLVNQSVSRLPRAAEESVMQLGFDCGFYAVKAIGTSAKGRELRVTFPSLVSTRVGSSFTLNGEDNIVIEHGEHNHLVGSGAVKRGAETVRKESSDWIGSPVWCSLFYATLSQLTKASHASVSVTTGLPLLDFERQREIVHETLSGEHTFKRDGHRQQTLTIDTCYVVPQAWGAVLTSLLDKSGNVVDPSLVDSKCAVIDVGGHNVNLLSIDGLTNVDTECYSTERGAWQVMRAVREYFASNLPDLNRHSDHRIMQAVTLGRIMYGGQSVNLELVVEPIVQSIAEEIIDTAAQRWGVAARLFDRVFVIGGGAYLFEQYLTSAIPHAEVLPLPEYVNALGYYKYTQYKTERGAR